MSTNLKSLSFSDLLRLNFPHDPTESQDKAIESFALFLSPKENIQLMILKGYAGTGKTTLIKTLADTLSAAGKNVILLSPTGRGAKVMSDISKHDAFTIHKHIYNFALKPNGSAQFKMAFNKYSNALFIIDEASMIQGGNTNREKGGFIMPDSGLLRDLFDFVHSNKDNKMLIIGDPAQLPPINHEQSPALNENYMAVEFDTIPLVVKLHEIVRQAKDSGILVNATLVRNLIDENKIEWPKFDTQDYDDIIEPEPGLIKDMIDESFNGKNNDSVIITVSNKMANKYNEFIRSGILLRENELDAGDMIMSVKNNYFWLDNTGKDFIANGEMMQIASVRNTEDKYGFRFADVSVKLLYQKGEPMVDMKVLLDTLHLPSPALPHERYMDLWNSIMPKSGGKLTKKKQLEILRENPYINALQIKFAWALTCHKAQGGQWKQVFVDTEFLMKRPAETSGLKWLYTAITRAREKLILLR